VTADRWVDVGGARCRYLSSWRVALGGVIASVRATRHDVLYLNGVFSLEFSVIPLVCRKLGLLPRRGLVVAPRGELDRTALAIKGRRKAMVLRLARRLGLFEGAIWHAATATEVGAITAAIGPTARALVARDIPMAGPAPQPEGANARATRPAKAPGTLELVFLGRIAPMKNLDFAISVLRSLQGSVHFSVFGPIEDQAYWTTCQRLAEHLPENVVMRYGGPVAPDEVASVLRRYHLFFQPSQAESFGHAITEAMHAGCPVLISDQTPWRELEAKHAGWDLPLARPDRFTDVINRCVDMTEAELDTWSAGARAYAAQISDDPGLDADYRLVFRAALSNNPLVPTRATRGASPT
jgi:glycosyltransferase involved in cell wall biosynthesis